MVQKQQQLLFDKGITNVPSDALCSDNALAESVGMIYDDGEHRVIQRPKEFIVSATYTTIATSGIPTIIYIHNYDNAKRYIGYVADKTLVWGRINGTDFTQRGTFAYNNNSLKYTDGTKIDSVGKTIIVRNDNGILYYLATSDGYKHLGPIPMPKPDFQMRSFKSNDNPETIQNLDRWSDNGTDYFQDGNYEYNEPNDVVKTSASFQGIFRTDGYENPPHDPDEEHSGDKWPDYHQEDYNNLVLGCYAKNKKTAAGKNGFCNPFFVRVALELYDGTYTHITNPVLMMPGVKNNSYARVSTSWNFTLYTFVRELMIKQEKDYTDWDDIVKDVVVFISDDIDVYDTAMDVAMYEELKGFECESLYNQISPDKSAFYTFKHTDLAGLKIAVEDPINHRYILTDIGTIQPPEDRILPYHYNPLKSRDEVNVIKSAKAASVFYKICKIGKTNIDNWVSTRDKIEQHVLDTLTSQEQLPYDDYFSGCSLKAGYVYTYNSRLNLADVRRGFFAGFDTFMPLDFSSGTTYTWYFEVTIKTDSGNKTVWHKVDSSNQKFGNYFYYPDPRASHVNIYRGNDKVFDKDLEEHPGLHGAYYIEKLYSEPTYTTIGSRGSGYVEPSTEYEYLPTYILTSQVNNPFVFLAEGYNSVGMGKVIGMSTITQALSEGQFGQYPLLVFATDGIWAMSVNETGMYSSVHPMSREVALEDNPCLTQTDGAVFFASKKGLMVVAGNQVKCVSEQMNGRTQRFNTALPTPVIDCGDFNEYLKNSFISYDYRDSLLWIFNGSRSTNNNYCYIYSIKSGTFGKFCFGTHKVENEDVETKVINVINNYPDYLLQTDDGNKIYSLLNRDDISSALGIYSGLILLTRPMKLENGFALKSIMDIHHVKDFVRYTINNEVKTGTIGFYMWGSNNCQDWVHLSSLRGIPWKYYRFGYCFNDLTARDRFSGSIIVTQERRTDKLR